MKHERDDDTNCNRYAQYSYQRIDKRLGGIGNKRTTGDDPNNRIVETAIVEITRILRKVLETRGDLLSLRLQWETSANVDVENSLRSKTIIIIPILAIFH